MITLDEKTIAVWYMQTDPKQDFMGGLYRDEKDILVFSYRFRYYKDDKAHDSKDEKHWYTVSPKEGEDISANDMLIKCREVVQMLALAANTQYDEILMKDGGVNQFIKEFSSKPWAHMKEVSPEEAEDYLKKGA